LIETKSLMSRKSFKSPGRSTLKPDEVSRVPQDLLALNRMIDRTIINEKKQDHIKELGSRLFY